MHVVPTEDHEELHQNAARQQAIDVDIPLATTTFRSRDVNVEQLVLVLASQHDPTLDPSYTHNNG